MAETALAASSSRARGTMRKRVVSLLTATALAFGGALLAPLAAQAAATPSFTAEVTENPNESIDIAIEGAGYDDVKALPGQTEPHAYFKLVEVGSDLSEVGQDDTAVSASVAEGGTLCDVLSVPIGRAHRASKLRGHLVAVAVVPDRVERLRAPAVRSIGTRCSRA